MNKNKKDIFKIKKRAIGKALMGAKIEKVSSDTYIPDIRAVWHCTGLIRQVEFDPIGDIDFQHFNTG